MFNEKVEWALECIAFTSFLVGLVVGKVVTYARIYSKFGDAVTWFSHDYKSKKALT